MARVSRLLLSLACALGGLALLGCGGSAATTETPAPRTAVAEPPDRPVDRAPVLLAAAASAWTANPAYADVDLPFVMGVTYRPCEAEYSVRGYPRIEVGFTYEPRRIRLAVTPGEMSGEGHSFCLPNPPFLSALELSPIVWTWELDEHGRVVGRAVEDEAGVRARVRYVWEGDRWTGVAFDDGAVQPVRWDGDLIQSAPHVSGGRTELVFDGERRLIERRTEAPDGALAISYYRHEENSPRLSERTFTVFPHPDTDASSSRTVELDLDEDGRLVRCTHGDLTVRYAYDAAGRLIERRAVAVDHYEGEAVEEEAWAWSYRYDCSAPR